MIKFKVDKEKDILTVIDKRDYDETKQYTLSDIAFISFQFYDDTETDSFIQFYLKSDVEKYEQDFKEILASYPDSPSAEQQTEMDDLLSDHQENLLRECFSYENQIDISYNDDFEEEEDETEEDFDDDENSVSEVDMHELFAELINFCTKNNINFVCPDSDDSRIVIAFEWLEQQEVIEWWKDDFIFRNIFSRN